MVKLFCSGNIEAQVLTCRPVLYTPVFCVGTPPLHMVLTSRSHDVIRTCVHVFIMRRPDGTLYLSLKSLTAFHRATRVPRYPRALGSRGNTTHGFTYVALRV